MASRGWLWISDVPRVQERGRRHRRAAPGAPGAVGPGSDRERCPWDRKKGGGLDGLEMLEMVVWNINLSHLNPCFLMILMGISPVFFWGV